MHSLAWVCLGSSLLLAGCAADRPVATPAANEAAADHPVHYDPAPMPRVHGPASAFNSYNLPVSPKMPYGTGAVPVSNSPVRGSFVTGVKQNF